MSKPPPPPLHLGGTAASPHSTGADGPPPPPFSSSSATSTTQPHHSASTPNGNANHPHPGSSASSSPSSAGTTQGAATTAPTAAQPAAPPAYPALHLTPLNGTFVPKQISLDHTTSGGGGGRVKIGRQINAKTVPNATNGYFDSKVLSRAHAEVWSEDGKVRRPPPPPPPRSQGFTNPVDRADACSAGLYQRRQVVQRHLYQRRAPLARIDRVGRL
jgi:hypothetical protein